jgi:hypothetical protein
MAAIQSTIGVVAIGEQSCPPIMMLDRTAKEQLGKMGSMLVLAHKLVVQMLNQHAELAQNEDQSNGRHSINNRSYGHMRPVLSTHYDDRSICKGTIGQDGINAGACPQIGRPDAHPCGIGPERRPVEWPPFSQ